MGCRGHVKKTKAERVLSQDQWKSVLAAVEANKIKFRHWKRDYTALYLGMMFGLRIGEVILLERRQFDDLEASETAHLPTLKQSERILVICRGTFEGEPCGKKVRLRADRGGGTFLCPRCSTKGIVPTPKVPLHTGVVEKDPPVIEESVIAYVADYLENHMRKDQRWLFEGKPGYHISSSYLSRIFNTYCQLAGIPAKYSFHSLRHGRGVVIWSRFGDLRMVAGCLRQQSMKSAEIYADLDKEKLDQYKQKLNRVAFNPLKGKANG